MVLPLVVWIAIMVICAVGAYMLSPKAKSNNPQAGTFDADSVPTIQQGKPLPVMWGTCLTTSPSVVWWGDVKAEPIYSKGGKK